MALLVGAFPAYAQTKNEITSAWNARRFAEVVRLLEQTPGASLPPDRRLVLALAALYSDQKQKARRHAEILERLRSDLNAEQNQALDKLLDRLDGGGAIIRMVIGVGSLSYSEEPAVYDSSLATAEAEAAERETPTSPSGLGGISDQFALEDLPFCTEDSTELLCEPAPPPPSFE